MLTLGVYAVVSEEGYVCFAAIFTLRIVISFLKETTMSWNDGIFSSVAAAFISGGIALLGTSSWCFGVIVILIGVFGCCIAYYNHKKYIEVKRTLDIDRVSVGQVSGEIEMVGRLFDELVYYSCNKDLPGGLVRVLDHLSSDLHSFQNEETLKVFNRFKVDAENLLEYIGTNFFMLTGQVGDLYLTPQYRGEYESRTGEDLPEYKVHVRKFNEILDRTEKSYDEFVRHLHSLGHI